jgi:hypothetical protein
LEAIMTNYADGSGPADVDLIAQLIDHSSLGSPPARAARAEVGLEDGIMLHERVTTEGGRGRWRDAPSSSVVVSTVGSALRGGEGLAGRLPAAGTIVAVTNREDVVVVDRSDPRLPGGEDGPLWQVCCLAAGPRCWTFELAYDQARRPPALFSTHLVVEVAVLWRVTDPARVVRSRTSDIARDLVPRIRAATGSLFSSQPDQAARPTAQQLVRFTDGVVRAFRDAGLAAEAVASPRLSRHLRPSDTAVYLLALMNEVTVPDRRAFDDDVRVALGTGRVADGDPADERAAFCRDLLPSLVATLRRLRQSDADARWVAIHAFEMVFDAWQAVGPGERTTLLVVSALHLIGGPDADWRARGTPLGDTGGGFGTGFGTGAHAGTEVVRRLLSTMDGPPALAVHRKS